MKVVNLLDNSTNTPIDPAVGIALVEGVAEPGVSVGLAVIEKNIRPHYQKVSDEIYYIIRGQGILSIEGEQHALREGDVISIPKGKVHGFTNTGNEPCYLLFASGPKFEPDKDRFFPE